MINLYLCTCRYIELLYIIYIVLYDVLHNVVVDCQDALKLPVGGELLLPYNGVLYVRLFKDPFLNDFSPKEYEECRFPLKWKFYQKLTKSDMHM